MQWIPISKSEHLNKYWIPRSGFEGFANTQVMQVGIAELAKLVCHYVLGFINSDTSFDLVALLGTGKGRNVYVSPDGKWLCRYIPGEIRSYPFSMKSTNDESQVLCIADTHLTDDAVNEKLFMENGELSNGMQQMMAFFQAYGQNRQQTKYAVAKLVEHKLIKPWKIIVPAPDGKDGYEVNGLHTIDENVLQATSPESLKDLRDSGALYLAYSQLLTAQNIEQLTTRMTYIESQYETQSQNSSEVFLASDDDQIDFSKL